MVHSFIDTLEVTANNLTQWDEMEQKLNAVEGSNIHKNKMAIIYLLHSYIFCKCILYEKLMDRLFIVFS